MLPLCEVITDFVDLLFSFANYWLAQVSVQWNLSNADTVKLCNIVCIIEVSAIQRAAFLASVWLVLTVHALNDVICIQPLTYLALMTRCSCFMEL